jgi:hypothetical protein
MNKFSTLYQKIAPSPRQSGPIEAVIGAVLLLAFAFNYFTQSSDLYKYFNSDALTIYAFVKDLLHFNGHASAWHFSNAPSFAPDYVIGFAASMLTNDLYRQIFFSSLIQVGLFYYVVSKLAVPLLGESASGYALLISLVVLLLAAKDVSPYYQVLILNWHFGTYLIGLFCLLIYVDLVAGKELLNRNATTRIPPLKSAMLCGMSFLMTLSDALFAIIFPIALLLVGGYCLATRCLSVKHFGTLFALPFVAALLAKYTAPHIVPNFGSLPLELSTRENLVPKLLEIYVLLQKVGIPSLFIALFFCWCLVQLTRSLGKDFKGQATDALARAKEFLALFVSLSLLINVVVVVASNALVGDRYLPSLFFAPFVFGFLLAPSVWRKTLLLRSALFVVLALYLLNAWSNRFLPLKADYYPEEVACIDNATRKLANPSGIGGYWQTKKLVAFSKRGARMVSVNPDLTPYDVLISNDWYRNNYNFAVINTAEAPNSMYLLNEKLIEEFNGKPDAVVFCKDAKILLYERGLSTTMDPERGSGKYLVQGCRLPHSTGNTNEVNACSLQSKNSTYAGNLSYGPYLRLPVGRYEFDLNYVSSNPVDMAVGHIDISSLLPEKHHILSEYKLMGSGGKEGHLKGFLEIDQNLKQGQLEIRTFVESNTEVEILSISVSRVKSVP